MKRVCFACANTGRIGRGTFAGLPCPAGCLKPEKPGVTFCKECNRKLTQGSPSCVRCGKCARLRRQP